MDEIVVAINFIVKMCAVYFLYLPSSFVLFEALTLKNKQGKFSSKKVTPVNRKVQLIPSKKERKKDSI